MFIKPNYRRFFFFQAEDGIRDFHVTGVQTCALPILLRMAGEVADGVLLNYLPASHVPWSVDRVREGGAATIYAYVHVGVCERERSEERRVGKEWRRGGGACAR